MFSRDPSRPFDAGLERRGFAATGPAGSTPGPVDGDAPTERTVDDSSAPEPMPGGIEGDPASETRPRDHHSRRSDGVEELREMEQNAEDGRE